MAAKMREEEEKIKRLKEEGYAKRKMLIDAAALLKKGLQVFELILKKIDENSYLYAAVFIQGPNSGIRG